jgi:hypothetical protein
MKKENDTGFSGWDFMMVRRVRGLFMVFLRDGDAGYTRLVMCKRLKVIPR